jgi:hypothetical protein
MKRAPPGWGFFDLVNRTHPVVTLSTAAGMLTNPPLAEGDLIRIIPHRGVDADCGSLEVWFADGRPSVRFYWDNLVSRRLRPGLLTREQAIEKATALARAEMSKLDSSE